MPAKGSSIRQRIAEWWSHRTLSQRFATLTAVLIAGGAIIQGAVLVAVAAQTVWGLESERAQQQLEKAAAHLTTQISEFRRVPLILSGTPPIPRIVDLSTGGAPRAGETLDVWRNRLSVIFRSIVQANPSLIQARLIGVADGGREIVRVNRAGDRIEIVADADLQRKGNRPYFRKTAQLRAGDVYLSPVDANIENEVVVQPIQPTIRAGTPIYTEQGALFGMIVANAAPDAWLRDISALLRPSGRFIAANQNGDYVFRTDGGPIFGSHSAAGSHFDRDWPRLKPLFQRNGADVLKLHEGDQFVAANRVAYNPDNPNDFVVLAASSDAKTVFGDTWTLILLGTAIAVTMSALGVLAAYFVSRPLKSLMSAARHIAEGKVNVAALAEDDQGADIGELGEALKIMKQAVESRDASLRKSEAYLQAIVDNTIDGLITVDPHGTILRYNRGCENIFGYASSEAIGRNISLLLPQLEDKQHGGDLQRYFHSGARRFIGVRRELKGRHKDGHLIDIEIAIAQINVGDEVIFSGIVRDITERKKIEQIKAAFVSTVTHELRTPLTSIMGSLALLRAGTLGPLSEKAARMINLAFSNGARLVKIVNEILDIDKIEAGGLKLELQNENLKALIEQAAEQNAGYASQHDAHIVVEEIPGDIVVETDPDRFQQVMGNLLSNAAKFSPSRGRITIAAKMQDAIVRVSIADQGPGIPPPFQARIFEKFAQADSSDTRERGGTGLGLSIAKAIIERLGGEIGFETRLGEGTTFYFELPAHRAALTQETPRRAQLRPAQESAARVQSANPESKARVLHIEDEADACAVLAELISDVAKVEAVSTAQEARKRLAKERFDLVILDAASKDGESILHDLSQQGTDAPRVIVYSVDEIPMDAFPQAAHAVVKSRTDMTTLRSHILALLHGDKPPPALKRSA